jgi:hypothetical protein
MVRSAATPRVSNHELASCVQLISFRTIAAASHIAFNLP